jgi:hypothetical protein
MAAKPASPETPEVEEVALVDGLTRDQLKALIADLNPNRIAHRSQGGSKLSYLEAWDVRASLIRVFGFASWSAEMLDKQVVEIENDVPKSGGGTTARRVTMLATMRLTILQTGAVYTEAAVSTQAGAIVGDVMDFALKTAASDALKRCAMNLGTQFGLSLYNKGSVRDIVRTVFAPGQMALIADIAVRKDAKDPTPDDAIAGVGDDEDDSEQPAAPEVWITLADKAVSADAVLEVWRKAKQSFGPQATQQMKDVLIAIQKIGEVKRDIERRAASIPQDVLAQAGEQMAVGFGGEK